MRTHIECSTPKVHNAAMRAHPGRVHYAVIAGARASASVLRETLGRCVAIGLQVNEVADRYMLTAGTCDVDGAWGRLRATARAEVEREWRVAAAMIRSDLDRREERRERDRRRADREAERATEVDLAGIVL